MRWPGKRETTGSKLGIRQFRFHEREWLFGFRRRGIGRGRGNVVGRDLRTPETSNTLKALLEFVGTFRRLAVVDPGGSPLEVAAEGIAIPSTKQIQTSLLLKLWVGKGILLCLRRQFDVFVKVFEGHVGQNRHIVFQDVFGNGLLDVQLLVLFQLLLRLACETWCIALIFPTPLSFPASLYCLRF